MSSEGPPERRAANRITQPECARCGSKEVKGAVRTDYVIYFRCSDCGNVWSVTKPERVHYGDPEET